MQPAAALASLQTLMERGAGRAVVAEVRWDRLRQATGAHPLPLLKRMLDGAPAIAAPAAPLRPAVAVRAADLAPLSEPERSARISQYVVSTLATVLGLKAGRLEADTPIGTLGFDSLMAMELRNRIESDAGVLVPVGEILTSGTAAEVAERIAAAVNLKPAGENQAPGDLAGVESFEF
jgi:acyl carrier protein